ncbi:MAG TPA: DUF308 domain-containing protein [Candidatus Eubacterium faecigallinarum]|nr:DUF308 domain-containing protein [Candidatus Eubacterium faecigallinarum]
MREILIRIKNLSLITIAAGFIIGIILLVRPDESVEFISILCGATVIMLGVGAWISYFTKFRSTFLAILGTLAVVAGIILCVKYRSIISAVLFLFGIFVLVGGVVDLVSALEARKNDLKSWIISVVMAVITIVLGLLVIINPFNSVMALTRILGAGLIVYAVMDLITFIQIRKMVKFTLNGQVDVQGREHTED